MSLRGVCDVAISLNEYKNTKSQAVMFGIFYLGNFILAKKAKTNRALHYIFLKRHCEDKEHDNLFVF